MKNLKTKWLRIKYHLLGLYISRRLSDLKWFVLHRFHPRYRYHVIRTGLPPGYSDERETLLHVSFNILKQFYERQIGPNGFVNWESDEKHSHAFSEMKVLYEWWTQTRPARESTLPPLPYTGQKVPFSVLFRDEEWLRIAGIHNQADEDWDKEDDAMLHRLIDIRLWMGD
jgi:hypothetical protein